ncbi:patatin-like phospholipase family protein [Roseovarius sp. ZX-A-9]|uniref:patatin-like phospholipase family protein n=1 Tax=Roseovarius sp. ZX-A-9 TaxID=3014783 RepID=UPI00232AF283|nr:patatin-like phospholipase family protein [Roseovarius sp. ZX-A-9]
MQVAVKGMITAAVAMLIGCSATNAPINSSLSSSDSQIETGFDAHYSEIDDGIYIGLAFSGGGTRASAFGYGMLQELRATAHEHSGRDGLLKHVSLVSGVSGGSVTAAYYGLYGAKGLDSFRDRYLIQNAEKYMSNSPYNPFTIARGLAGGANGRNTFARFLDESIFKNATFADLAQRGHAITWINAADVANNTPFLFSSETFDALCSDLGKLPVSEAVAASAAFPLVFSPIVLEAHTEACDYSEPDWLTSARFNPEATSAMRAYGQTLESYRDPEKVKYVKLLDGGITDNFGTTGLTMARAKSQTPFGPLSAQEAVKLRRMLFLVANAGVQSDYKWTKQQRGPGGLQLAMSIANSSMSSATRTGYDLMRVTLDDWVKDMIEYRCSLSRSEVRRLRGSLEGWDCSDVKLFVGQISFQDAADEERTKLNAIPTRLKLKAEEVDLVIAAAREATRGNSELNGFLRSIDGTTAKSIATSGARRITPQ